MSKMDVYGIHDGSFFIQYYIGIIRHAIRDRILSFEKINLMIVDSHVMNCVCN